MEGDVLRELTAIHGLLQAVVFLLVLQTFGAFWGWVGKRKSPDEPGE